MNALRFTIRPVYSAEHPDHQIGSMRLLRHQAETWKAFHDPDVDVIFNTAMTGDGKSLAAYLPVFKEGKRIIAMYPTNELILDQHHALLGYEKRLGIQLSRNATMYGEKISHDMQEQDIKKRLEAVRQLLKYNPILLTNPDLVHLIMSHQYGWDYLRKELPTQLSASFDYFVFDEFHVFGVPQIISVMNMLGYLNVAYRDKPRDRKKFVFLSATPNKLMDDLLERSGLHTKKIAGNYISLPQDNYHCILQGCELELHELSQDMSQGSPMETWVEEHLEEMRAFFDEHRDSKAAILVYSVATARKLYTRLYDYFEKQRGITVGENTGLTYRGERHDALKKQILVGTTTVDIGIDFRINYLVFEAYDAGSFLQRFGRLGRHEGYDAYRAYGLIPRFVLERLRGELGVEGEVGRERFNTVIRESFPFVEEFKGYMSRWGVKQAAQVLMALESEGKLDANDAFTAALMDRYERMYGSPEQPVMPKKVKSFWGIQHRTHEIADELSSFRGQSPLTCGVWDSDNHLKTYDLLFLVANAEIEVLSEAEFMDEVRQRIQTGSEKPYERDFLKRLLYLKVHKYIPERQRLTLGIDLDLSRLVDKMHKVSVCPGFYVEDPVFPWKDQVDKALKAKKLVCIFSDWTRAELKGRLHLPALFPIYAVRDRLGQCYSVAFGQEALLLDSLLYRFQTKGDTAMFL
ncbi:MAG TPA: type I-D CRISPR-associated helicase Cas3' [Ktedonobacteraceae bacterium]|nr:type I-D CRISPR-associated helicase Cas3' [Ktedonobacteraceae bacterium]